MIGEVREARAIEQKVVDRDAIIPSPGPIQTYDPAKVKDVHLIREKTKLAVSKARDSAKQAILETLTMEQRERYRSLLGKPFDEASGGHREGVGVEIGGAVTCDHRSIGGMVP